MHTESRQTDTINLQLYLRVVVGWCFGEVHKIESFQTKFQVMRRESVFERLPNSGNDELKNCH